MDKFPGFLDHDCCADLYAYTCHAHAQPRYSDNVIRRYRPCSFARHTAFG
jgi:hypothetical protein